MRWPLLVMPAVLVAVGANLSVKTYTYPDPTTDPAAARHYLEIAGIECNNDGDVSAQINLGGWSSPPVPPRQPGCARAARLTPFRPARVGVYSGRFQARVPKGTRRGRVYRSRNVEWR